MAIDRRIFGANSTRYVFVGNNSKVLMIVHISLGDDDAAETVCSLSFAKRVRAVEANRELSAVPSLPN